MNEQTFFEDFMDKCIDDGIKTPAAMIQVALDRIEEIDQEMKKFIELQSERNNLNNVLKSLNYTPKAKPNSKRAKAIEFSNQESILSDDEKTEIQEQILTLFKSGKNVALSGVQISEHILGKGIDASPVFLALKLMQESNLLTRNESKKFILA